MKDNRRPIGGRDSFEERPGAPDNASLIVKCYREIATISNVTSVLCHTASSKTHRGGLPKENFYRCLPGCSSADATAANVSTVLLRFLPNRDFTRDLKLRRKKFQLVRPALNRKTNSQSSIASSNCSLPVKKHDTNLTK
ncbi:uncharacterized protein LOC143148288 [Ptiloglossa arizonensis]|uniref:uncharacterized protein LOC143148288 n=1 Tax=Ptiloglossa arizonensis TaxID=3350558 RepID=UPI003FA06839